MIVSSKYHLDTINDSSVIYPMYIFFLYILVGGFNHLEKYELVNVKDDIPYMKLKTKFMFETTNQIAI